MLKGSFTKLLLALSLVINPVAVLAVDFHDMEVGANQTLAEFPHDTADQPERQSQTAQHDDVNCEMPCCEDSECGMQDICFIQHNSDFVTQKPLNLGPPISYQDWCVAIALIPELDLPPDNPPPILI